MKNNQCRTWNLESLVFKDRVSIVTHDGKFHADEVTAVALLMVFAELQGGLSLIRTRDEKAFSQANFVIDVGAKHDGIKYFDHHHFDKADENYGFSSAGLIMCFLNIDQGKYSTLDFLIDEVDENDTGFKRHSGNHYCGIINSFNADDVYSSEQNIQFEKATEFALEYILNIMRSEDLKKKQRELADAVRPQKIQGINIIVLDKDDLFIPARMFNNVADIVVQYDEHKKSWNAQTVNLNNHEFKSKWTFVPTGRPSEEFCHKAGFITSMQSEDNKIHLQVQSGVQTKKLEIVL